MPDVGKKKGLDKSAEQAKTLDKDASSTAGKDRSASESKVKQATQALLGKLDEMQAGAEKALKANHQTLQNYAGAGVKKDADDPQRQQASAGLQEFAGRQAGHLEERNEMMKAVHDQLDKAVAALNEQQAGERQQAPAAKREQLDERHAAQWDAMAQAVAKAEQGLQALQARDDARLREDRAGVMQAAQNPGELGKQLEASAKREEPMREALSRDAGRLEEDLARDISSAQNKMGQQELSKWREALGAVQLSDEAIQRIRSEGMRVTKPEKQDAQEALLKGQLMEEIAINQQLVDRIIGEETERLRQAGNKDAEVRFFDGNQVRDDEGAKLSDGFFAWKDKQDAWHPVHALEAKAGAASSRELEKKRDAPSADLLDETRKLARDIVRDETAKQPVSQKTFDARVEQTFNELAKRQTELGQLSKTLERLASGNDQLYINGKAEKLANDGKALRTTGLVTSDSRFTQRSAEKAKEDQARSQRYLAASVTAAQLNEMARRMRELLADEEKNRPKAAAQKTADDDEEA